jgi:hypothetical protein
MSGKSNKNEDNDLTSFEAALRGLRPRSDGLDDQWPTRLAKEASLRSELPSPFGIGAATSLPSPFGRGAGGEGCVNPTGHQFLCIHCGSDLPMVGVNRRWGWPAAFSTMTAVAAALLLMLVTHAGPQIGVQDAELGDTIPASSQASLGRRPLTTVVERDARTGDEMPYLALRDQVLRDGVDSWKMPLATRVTAATTEGPLNCREQLKRLLEQDLRGS